MSLDVRSSEPCLDLAISWREIAAGLWVGRADGFPAGIIERGPRFTFTDPDGGVFSGFATLGEAQAAANHSWLAVQWPTLEPDRPISRIAAPLMLSAGVVGACAIVLGGFALTLL